MSVRRLATIAVLVLAAPLVLAACGNDDAVGEKIAEEAIENAGNGDVDVDVDGEDVTVKSSDGDASFSSSDELPEDWPAELALPDGAKVVGSSTVGAEGGSQQTVNATTDSSPNDVFDHFDGQLDGWDEEGKSSIDSGEGALVTASWSKGDAKVTLTATESDGETTFVIGSLAG